MRFVARSIIVAGLTTIVGFVLFVLSTGRCPIPRYVQIGGTTDGKVIIVFDACLGFAYASPVAGLDSIRKQKDIEI